MDSKKKRKYRDMLRFTGALLFSWLYIPHFAMMYLWGGKQLIYSDIAVLQYQISIKINKQLSLLYLLHNNRYFRTVFYHRIGPIKSMLISWLRPGDKYFTIGQTVKIGKSFWFAHPYATVLAADSIGDNFRCIHCTTLGNGNNGRPTIGNNVALGANVTIVGKVCIGNNVKIGAGSVIVKNVPDNCVVVGNPARIVKKNGERVNIPL